MSMLTMNAEHHSLMSHFHKPEDEKRSIIVIPNELRDDWLHCNFEILPQFFKPSKILKNSSPLAMPR